MSSLFLFQIMMLDPEDRKLLYEYMRSNGYTHLTIKILLGYMPDGIDRLTVMLGKATEYDYKLLEDEDFRMSELERIYKLTKSGLLV